MEGVILNHTKKIYVLVGDICRGHLQYDSHKVNSIEYRKANIFTVFKKRMFLQKFIKMRLKILTR